MCLFVYVVLCVCVHARALVCHKQLLLQCLGLRALSNAYVSVKYPPQLVLFKQNKTKKKAKEIAKILYGEECSENMAPVDIIEILAR